MILTYYHWKIIRIRAFWYLCMCVWVPTNVLRYISPTVKSHLISYHWLTSIRNANIHWNSINFYEIFLLIVPTYPSTHVECMREKKLKIEDKLNVVWWYFRWWLLLGGWSVSKLNFKLFFSICFLFVCFCSSINI